MQSQIDKRSIFDWLIFTLIHVVVIVAIGYAGIEIYGPHLGLWVAASATVAGFASCYLFAKDIPGETFMKVVLGLAVAANAGYIIHNGAKKIGVKDYNAAQVERYERGIEAAGRAGSRRMARTLALSVENASKLETVFSDGVALIAAILAFVELAFALAFFAIGSRRLKAEAAKIQLAAQGPTRSQELARRQTEDFDELEARQRLIEEIDQIRAYRTGRLEGKDSR